MTKKEKAYIQGKANQFLKWYEEEDHKSLKANDPDEKAEHQKQARLNWNTYNAYEQLLEELEELTNLC